MNGRAPVRLGIMSLAHLHAEGYLETLRRMPGVELVGFSEPEPERGEHFAALFGARRFERHEDLLAEGLDGVIVCSENARHLELVELAAAAGCHVLCEKQVEVSLERARAERDACTRHGVRFMTAFPMRFSPPLAAARAAVRRGDLGGLYGVNGVNHSEMPRRHRAWFADKALAGGGAVMDHTPHLVDLLRWTLESEVVEVYAEVGTPFYRGEVEVDTAGLALLTFENGVFASLDCSWSRPAAYPRWGHLKLEFVGERGALAVDAFAEKLSVYASSEPRPAAWLGFGPDADRAMLGEFVSSLRENREPAVGWRDGYEALRVALACYESAEKGQPVRLEHGLP